MVWTTSERTAGDTAKRPAPTRNEPRGKALQTNGGYDAWTCHHTMLANRPMTKPSDTQIAGLLDYAREQGRLSGEMRMLKWAVGAAFVALIAALGAIYTEMNQGFREVNQQFREVNARIDELAHGVTDIRERLTHVEGRLTRVEGRLTTVEGYIGDLRAAGTPQAHESPP